MARARMVRFTTEGKWPRARLIIEADGAKTEYSIRSDKNNTVRLHFVTTDLEEAERGAVLRAVGVKAEVKKVYHKFHNRDVWYRT